jgi:hypothetical protein
MSCFVHTYLFGHCWPSHEFGVPLQVDFRFHRKQEGGGQENKISLSLLEKSKRMKSVSLEFSGLHGKHARNRLLFQTLPPSLESLPESFPPLNYRTAI